jgi:hypothetical protein
MSIGYLIAIQALVHTAAHSANYINVFGDGAWESVFTTNRDQVRAAGLHSTCLRA